MGAATAACIGGSMRDALGQHLSAVAVAALCSTVAQCIATTIAAVAIAALGDSWRASVTPGIGDGDYATLGRDTRKLVRKQSAKAAVKSLAARALTGIVGCELGVVATVAYAITTAVTGGVVAAVSIECTDKRRCSLESVLSTAYKATYKTAIKTAIATSLRESLRQGMPFCGPVVTSALCCGTGIGLRNWIVDLLHESTSSRKFEPCAAPPTHCPHRKFKPHKTARCCQ